MGGRYREHTILHVTDTHLSTAPPKPGAPDAEANLLAVLQRVAASGCRIDAVVHTGDITDDASPAATDRVATMLATFGAPVVAVPGNHDDPAVVDAIFGPPQADVHGWRIVGIDSVVAGEIAGAVPAQAEQWPDADAPLPTLVAVHHPPRSHSTHPWFQLSGADQLLQWLDRRPHVAAVLSGHTHQSFDDALPNGCRLLGGRSTYYGLEHHGPTWHAVPGHAGAQLIDLMPDGSVNRHPVMLDTPPQPPGGTHASST